MQVFNSRYTPGVSGDSVSFNKGEVVGVRSPQSMDRIAYGEIISERCRHKDSQYLGYEIKFDDGVLFVEGNRIVEWNGKV